MTMSSLSISSLDEVFQGVEYVGAQPITVHNSSAAVIDTIKCLTRLGWPQYVKESKYIPCYFVASPSCVEVLRATDKSIFLTTLLRQVSYCCRGPNSSALSAYFGYVCTNYVGDMPIGFICHVFRTGSRDAAEQIVATVGSFFSSYPDALTESSSFYSVESSDSYSSSQQSGSVSSSRYAARISHDSAFSDNRSTSTATHGRSPGRHSSLQAGNHAQHHQRHRSLERTHTAPPRTVESTSPSSAQTPLETTASPRKDGQLSPRRAQGHGEPSSVDTSSTASYLLKETAKRLCKRLVKHQILQPHKDSSGQTHPACFSGDDIVTWLVSQKDFPERKSAIRLLQSFLAENIMIPLSPPAPTNNSNNNGVTAGNNNNNNNNNKGSVPIFKDSHHLYTFRDDIGVSLRPKKDRAQKRNRIPSWARIIPTSASLVTDLRPRTRSRRASSSKGAAILVTEQDGMDEELSLDSATDNPLLNMVLRCICDGDTTTFATLVSKFSDVDYDTDGHAGDKPATPTDGVSPFGTPPSQSQNNLRDALQPESESLQGPTSSPTTAADGAGRNDSNRPSSLTSAISVVSSHWGKKLLAHKRRSSTTALITIGHEAEPDSAAAKRLSGVDLPAHMEQATSNEAFSPTPLQWSQLLFLALSERMAEMADIILEKGVRINAPLNENGDTPLHKAAACNNVVVVKALLSREANVNITNNQLSTPLFHAAQKAENIEACILLIEYGATIRCVNADGKRPVDYQPSLAEVQRRLCESIGAGLLSGKHPEAIFQSLARLSVNPETHAILCEELNKTAVFDTLSLLCQKDPTAAASVQKYVINSTSVEGRGLLDEDILRTVATLIHVGGAVQRTCLNVLMAELSKPASSQDIDFLINLSKMDFTPLVRIMQLCSNVPDRETGSTHYNTLTGSTVPSTTGSASCSNNASLNASLKASRCPSPAPEPSSNPQSRPSSAATGQRSQLSQHPFEEEEDQATASASKRNTRSSSTASTHGDFGSVADNERMTTLQQVSRLFSLLMRLPKARQRMATHEMILAIMELVQIHAMACILGGKDDAPVRPSQSLSPVADMASTGISPQSISSALVDSLKKLPVPAPAHSHLSLPRIAPADSSPSVDPAVAVRIAQSAPSTATPHQQVPVEGSCQDCNDSATIDQSISITLRVCSNLIRVISNLCCETSANFLLRKMQVPDLMETLIANFPAVDIITGPAKAALVVLGYPYLAQLRQHDDSGNSGSIVPANAQNSTCQDHAIEKLLQVQRNPLLLALPEPRKRVVSDYLITDPTALVSSTSGTSADDSGSLTDDMYEWRHIKGINLRGCLKTLFATASPIRMQVALLLLQRQYNQLTVLRFLSFFIHSIISSSVPGDHNGTSRSSRSSRDRGNGRSLTSIRREHMPIFAVLQAWVTVTQRGAAMIYGRSAKHLAPPTTDLLEHWSKTPASAWSAIDRPRHQGGSMTNPALGPASMEGEATAVADTSGVSISVPRQRSQSASKKKKGNGIARKSPRQSLRATSSSASTLLSTGRPSSASGMRSRSASLLGSRRSNASKGGGTEEDFGQPLTEADVDEATNIEFLDLIDALSELGPAHAQASRKVLQLWMDEGKLAPSVFRFRRMDGALHESQYEKARQLVLSGAYALPREIIVTLAALQVLIEELQHKKCQPHHLVDNPRDISFRLKQVVPAAFAKQKSLVDAISTEMVELAHLNLASLHHRYLSLCQLSQGEQSQYFNVKVLTDMKKRKKVQRILGVSKTAVTLIDPKNKHLLQTLSLMTLSRWERLGEVVVRGFFSSNKQSQVPWLVLHFDEMTLYLNADETILGTLAYSLSSAVKQLSVEQGVISRKTSLLQPSSNGTSSESKGSNESTGPSTPKARDDHSSPLTAETSFETSTATGMPSQRRNSEALDSVDFIASTDPTAATTITAAITATTTTPPKEKKYGRSRQKSFSFFQRRGSKRKSSDKTGDPKLPAQSSPSPSSSSASLIQQGTLSAAIKSSMRGRSSLGIVHSTTATSSSGHLTPKNLSRTPTKGGSRTSLDTLAAERLHGFGEGTAQCFDNDLDFDLFAPAPLPTPTDSPMVSGNVTPTEAGRSSSPVRLLSDANKASPSVLASLTEALLLPPKREGGSSTSGPLSQSSSALAVEGDAAQSPRKRSGSLSDVSVTSSLSGAANDSSTLFSAHASLSPRPRSKTLSQKRKLSARRSKGKVKVAGKVVSHAELDLGGRRSSSGGTLAPWRPCKCPPRLSLQPHFDLTKFTLDDLIAHPKELAKQMTVVEHFLFREISAMDCCERLFLPNDATAPSTGTYEHMLHVHRDTTERANAATTSSSKHSSAKKLARPTHGKREADALEGALAQRGSAMAKAGKGASLQSPCRARRASAYRDGNKVTGFIQHFNHISSWVSTVIVTAETIQQRCHYMSMFIYAANFCRVLSNFNGVVEILSALSTAAVARLTDTWDALPQKVADLHAELSQMVSAENNFRNYRKQLAGCKCPCVPYFGVYLRDMTFVHQGNQDYSRRGLFNMSKARLLGNLLTDMAERQQGLYNIAFLPEITDFLLNKTQALGEGDLFRISQGVQPPRRQSKLMGSLRIMGTGQSRRATVLSNTSSQQQGTPSSSKQ